MSQETQAGFLKAVRWWSVSRDYKGTPDSQRKANRRALRILTAVARIIPGPLDLEYYGPRLDGLDGPADETP